MSKMFVNSREINIRLKKMQWMKMNVQKAKYEAKRQVKIRKYDVARARKQANDSINDLKQRFAQKIALYKINIKNNQSSSIRTLNESNEYVMLLDDLEKMCDYTTVQKAGIPSSENSLQESSSSEEYQKSEILLDEHDKQQSTNTCGRNQCSSLSKICSCNPKARTRRPPRPLTMDRKVKIFPTISSRHIGL